ncbi:MAG: hypothetical protein DWQ31_07615 [Planctomycetota bacterium]|nr:MAG: hypothetical protein DWQ31_07615 [Planctomycetota bacterium]
MRYIFRIFAILTAAGIAAVIWADVRHDPSPAPVLDRDPQPITGRTGDLPDGEQLIAACAVALQSMPSVSAQMRQRVRMFDREVFGSGIYLQEGRGERAKFRLELSFQLAGTSRGLIRSSDGVMLWLFDDNRDTGAQLREIDLQRLELAVQRYRMEAGVAEDQVSGSPGPPDLSRGGLPQVLADLRANFEFQTVGQTRLEGLSAWVVQGVWREAPLRALLQHVESDLPLEQRGLAELDAHVPHDVLIFVDQEELFPYRFQFRRGASNDASDAAPTTIVDMELFEVRFDVPIEASQFGKPVDLQATDHTDTYAQQLVKRLHP